MVDKGETVTLSETTLGSDPGEAPDVVLDAGTRVDRYRIVSKLGSGGMGVVYVAEDPELGRSVALKLVRADASGVFAEANLVYEARAMAKLQHPNVVTVYDVGIFGNRVFIAMELVNGTTLREWLATERPPLRRILRAFIDAGRGLNAAHAAGLVHRDFKPENVLLGADGVARVTDFGLARPLNKEPDTVRVESERSTHRAGGTPRYMAPEQHGGGVVAEAADQYAFALALWEAVAGEYPIRVESETQLAEAKRNVQLRLSRTRMPRWLARMLRRALAPESRDRFGSIADLVSLLERRQRRRTVVVGAMAGVAVASAVLTATLVSRRDDTARMCRGAEAEAATVWNEARRAAMRAAFLDAKVPYAEAAFRATSNALDEAARGWATTRTATCEATHVHGVQSSQLLDARMECLRRRLQEIRARVDVLIDADAKTVENAVQAVRSLDDAAGCATSSLQDIASPPLAMASLVAAKQSELAALDAMNATGKDGLRQARSLVATAKQIGYRPLEAEALLVQGDYEIDAGDYKAARTTLDLAARIAIATHQDEVVAKAWTLLGRVIGFDQAHVDEGLAWLDYASAALDRLPAANERLRARLLAARSYVLRIGGKYGEAVEMGRHAVSLVEKTRGRDHFDLVAPLQGLAAGLFYDAKYRETIEAYDRIIVIAERELGTDHPTVAANVNNLAVALRGVGENERALTMFRRVLATKQRILPADHPSIAATVQNLGLVLSDLGQYDESVMQLERAVAIYEKALGKEHPDIAHSLIGIGQSLAGLHKLDEATKTYERALAMQEKTLGAQHPMLGYTLTSLANAWLDLGKPERALALHLRALSIWEAGLGKTHPDLADAYSGIGRAQLALGRPEQAIAPLERAIEVRGNDDKSPSSRANVELALARAVWSARHDAPRARALAQQARTVYVGDALHKDKLASTDELLGQLPR